jgi:hypothetical protein
MKRLRWTIVPALAGGTGRFAGATGSGTASGSGTAALDISSRTGRSLPSASRSEAR